MDTTDRLIASQHEALANICAAAARDLEAAGLSTPSLRGLELIHRDVAEQHRTEPAWIPFKGI